MLYMLWNLGGDSGGCQMNMLGDELINKQVPSKSGMTIVKLMSSHK